MIGNKENPISAFIDVALGYYQKMRLQREEIDILFYLAALRICHSVVASAYESSLPSNKNKPYIMISARPGWECLQWLATRRSLDGPSNRLFEVLTGKSKDNCQCKRCSIM
eukprot:CAMPEP_0185257002 /NCGR_PEP_ID=MMETSP1359-20130426/6066_1 /TAXON_ID=552665 /ORGANISM="Bigelowiella longifila, Strain CCMP242" /LENGTH=110 /DNA_ID=CAMNT_0027841857 /DNA_START=32 /DNA_END=364 /DNA_ORIENTATION=-